MLGILLIYFIGKKFYSLSETYNQNKWLYTILSVVIYYVAGIVFGVILYILDDLIFNWGINWDDNYGINLLGIPVGLLAAWGFYVLLESCWKKSVVLVKDEIHDIGNHLDTN